MQVQIALLAAILGRIGLRAAVWLQDKVLERGLALRSRLNNGPVSDAAEAIHVACSAI